MRKHLGLIVLALACVVWCAATGAGQGQGTATIVVKVPESATLKIGAYVSTQTGKTRTLITPSLDPGFTYTYELESTWTDGGKSKKVTRTVKFQANATVNVDLREIGTVAKQPADKTPRAKVDVAKPKPVDKTPAVRVDVAKPKPVDKTPAVKSNSGDKIRVVLIDGQNNHNWRTTTPVMKKALEDSGRFTVEVATAPERPKTPQKPKTDNPEDLAKFKEAQAKQKVHEQDYKAAMAKFVIPFEKYQVVLSNYNGDSWPKETETALDNRLKEGKIGLVIVHAADNSFGGWKEYNLMIGMGWRGKGYGERLKVDDSGKEVRVPAGEDLDTGHRYSGPFKIIVRDSGHPITKGMPPEWMHAQDELYDNLRGPIQNVHLLATALAPAGKGTGVQEPMIFTIDYGKGRVFHTPMGHDVNGMRCVGFIGTLQRGTEWAATGTVTLPLPANFPTADKTSSVPAK